jgi:hypothetical protein
LYSENVRRLLKENFGMVCPKIYVCQIRIRIRKKKFCGSESEKKSFRIHNTGFFMLKPVYPQLWRGSTSSKE